MNAIKALNESSERRYKGDYLPNVEKIVDIPFYDPLWQTFSAERYLYATHDF